VPSDRALAKAQTKEPVMTVEKLNPAGLHEPVSNLYAHVVRAVGTVHYRIGGQVPVGPDGGNLHRGDMAAQIRECYEQVTIALGSVGLSWQDVTHIYTFTTDIDEYLRREPPIAKAFFGETPPASTLVEVARLVERDWVVEVQVDAVSDH
jgi:enamine deaminase RidA (YjgF/YER057c/UK114 family)